MDQPPSARTHQTLNAVDALRLVAALSVMAFHFGTLGVRVADPRLDGFIVQDRVPAALARWLDHGWIGVEIFFVISGYVIAMSALGSSRSAFLRRRLLRLLPGAWMCATLTLAILLVTARYDLGILIGQWLFSVTLFPFGESIDPSYWTIGIELSFYALVAACIGGAGTRRALWLVATGLGTISGIFWIGALAHIWPSHVGRASELLLLEHGCFFALGMVAWLHVGRAVTPAGALLLGGLTGFCVIEIAVHQSTIASDNPFQNLPAIAAFLGSLALLFSAPALQPALERSPLQPAFSLIGRATYPIYLLHQTMGSVLIGTLLVIGVNVYAALVMAAVLVVALGIAMTWRIEPAVRRYADQHFMVPRAGLAHVLGSDNPVTASPPGG